VFAGAIAWVATLDGLRLIFELNRGATPR
jgi:hypothetical protein